MPRPRSPWCKHGHHKPTVGYSGKYGCRECDKAHWRDYQRRRRAAKYGGVPDLYGAGREPLVSLRDTRLSLNLTQRQLAYRSGVTQAAISKLERGDSNGYPSTRAKLLSALSPLLAERRERLQKSGV